MSTPSVVIVDYGVGNLFNVERAFHALGAQTLISNDIKKIEAAERIVLPGVGAFAAGMEGLRQHGLVEVLQSVAAKGTPFFGICLGMQLLMNSSEENGQWNGLGLLAGNVKRFTAPTPGGLNFKIPQIGWNTLERAERDWENTILKSTAPHSFVYFVHSYHVVPEFSNQIIAQTNYGSDRFCSVIQNGSIAGCQFHPERSGNAGLQILKNFLDLDR